MITSSNYSEKGVIRRHTSGTTGKPVEVLWDNAYCDVVAALRLMNVRATGSSHFAKTVEIQYWGPSRPEVRGQKPNRLRKLLLGPLDAPRLLTLRARTRGFHRTILELEKELHRIKPSAIQSRPSYLRRLGAQLLRRGPKLPVRNLVTEGEYLSSAVRKDLSKMFDAEVFNTYGSMEAGPFGIECRIHEGIHLSTDYFAFEVVRDGQAVSPEEQGDILVTTLDNRFMPLIRYRLGDSVVLESEERCRCGSSLPRLREVFGRTDDGLVIPTGGKVPTGEITNYLEGFLGLRDYQLVQTSVSSFLLKVKVEQDNPALRASMHGYVTSLIGQVTDLEVEYWMDDDIPPKYRPVVSRISAR